MKVWILVILALSLLIWGIVRERFEPTASIRAPPYDDAEKLHIFGVASTASQQVLLDKAKSLVTVPETDTTYQEKQKIAAGGLVAPIVGDFFNAVFKPAKTPIRDSDVTNFMSSRSSDIKSIEEEVLKTYFVGQQGIGTSQSSGYADILASEGQNVGYLNSNVSGPTGGTTTSSANTGATGTTGSATTAGGTTGGSSTTSAAPTTRRTGARGVFGPEFGGFGQGSSGNNPHRDSTKTNTYPELLGGGDSKPRTLVDGAGLVNPSKNWQLANDGSLPTSTSLGSDENSKYLPYSRQPGDMDLIPDPYRVSQSYMASSYSFKTEPTPFLTDFSAFLR